MFKRLFANNLNGDQLPGKGNDMPTHYAPKAALSAYHSEHPIDRALGAFRIARTAKAMGKGGVAKGHHGEVLNNVAALQKGVSGG